jgi:hypothetical protein
MNLHRQSLTFYTFFRTNGKRAADNYSPARRRLPMTSGGSSVGSLAGISAVVDTDEKTTSIEIFGTDDSLSVGSPAASSLPSLPQHDPYTPRKRRDPDYVPYYVTNFEYILRCVIDCTDDRDLFNSQEIGIFCFSLPSLFVKLTHIFTVFYKINNSLSSSEKTCPLYDSVCNQSFGSGFAWIRVDRLHPLTPKKGKVKKFHVLKCWMFSFVGSFMEA